MTTKKQNTQEGSKFVNMKQLYSILQSDTVTSFLTDIEAMKKKLDALCAEQKKVLRAKEEVQPAAKAESEIPAPPPPAKKTISINEIIDNSEKKEPPVKSVSSGKRVSATAEPKPVAKQPKPAPKPATTTVQPTATTSTGYTPSYIKGIVQPVQPPQPKPQPKKPAGTPKKDFPPKRPASSPQGSTGAARPSRPALMTPPIVSKERKPDKKKEHPKTDEKKGMSKRTLIRKGFITENLDEERMGSRKLKVKRPKEHVVVQPKKIEKAVITTENLTVKILSEKIGKTAQEIIKQLMILGIVKNINDVVDFPTMELVAGEFGVELELKLEQSKESLLEEMHEEADDEKDLVKRPPIITVMGHVDHGKTSLLDAIRKTAVASGEAGGITQHIGAYSVMCNDEKITFLDTPGHEAFTEMRKRGAFVTDIAVLIVAADDGIMPQTVEAINHAKAANVPILVAINKIDKPGANIEKIKQDLTAYGLVCEEWGGETIIVPLSAKTGVGIDKLLEMILFLAEYNNYRANPNRKAKGSIIESKLDKGKGPIANIIVQNGTLKVGDYVVSGTTYGRIRAMVDDKGRNIKEAPPSTPVSILGFTDVPQAGDPIYAVDDEKTARQVTEERMAKFRNEQANQGHKASLDELIDKINEGSLKELSIIIKADVQGSVEAIKNSLLKLSSDEVRINVIHGGVGAINKSDIMLAEVSHAMVIGFNVRPDGESRTLAEKSGIQIRLYKIIYEVIDDVEKAMHGMITPVYKEVPVGRAQVRNVFKITGVGMVAGSYVLNGKIVRGAKARVYRDGEMIHEGTIEGLKRFKDDVKEVATGFECGISVSGFSDIKENDEIEAFSLEVVNN